MRWPGIFRRRQDDPDVVPATPGSVKLWAEVALPPPLDAQTRTPNAAPEPDAYAPILTAPRQAVRLGFADGTSVELDHDSAQALRDVAVRLTAGEPA